MPFKSKAQQRFAFGTKQPWAKEWADKTKSFKKLPEKVGKGMAKGKCPKCGMSHTGKDCAAGKKVGKGQAMPMGGPPPGMMPGMGMPPMPPMMPPAQSGMPEPLRPKKPVKKPRKSKAKPTPGTSGPRKKPAIQKRFSPRGGMG